MNDSVVGKACMGARQFIRGRADRRELSCQWRCRLDLWETALIERGLTLIKLNLA